MVLENLRHIIDTICKCENKEIQKLALVYLTFCIAKALQNVIIADELKKLIESENKLEINNLLKQLKEIHDFAVCSEHEKNFDSELESPIPKIQISEESKVNTFSELLDKKDFVKIVPKNIQNNTSGSIILFKQNNRYVFSIGDLHGDKACLDQLIEIIYADNNDNSQSTLQKQNPIIVFLGDYFDKGKRSLETFLTVAILHACYSRSFITLRGNHEYEYSNYIQKNCNYIKWGNLIDPQSDFIKFLSNHINDQNLKKLCNNIKLIIDGLPTAALAVDAGALFTHGAPPMQKFNENTGINQFLWILLNNTFLMVWNDVFKYALFLKNTQTIVRLGELEKITLLGISKLFRGHQFNSLPVQSYSQSNSSLKIYTLHATGCLRTDDTDYIWLLTEVYNNMKFPIAKLTPNGNVLFFNPGSKKFKWLNAKNLFDATLVENTSPENSKNKPTLFKKSDTEERKLPNNVPNTDATFQPSFN